MVSISHWIIVNKYNWFEKIERVICGMLVVVQQNCVRIAGVCVCVCVEDAV